MRDVITIMFYVTNVLHLQNQTNYFLKSAFLSFHLIYYSSQCLIVNGTHFRRFLLCILLLFASIYIFFRLIVVAVIMWRVTNFNY